MPVSATFHTKQTVFENGCCKRCGRDLPDARKFCDNCKDNKKEENLKQILCWWDEWAEMSEAHKKIRLGIDNYVKP